MVLFSYLKFYAHKYNRGLTLIELLFTITIIAVCFGLFNNIHGIIKHYYYHKNKIIISQLNHLIHLARNSALITRQNINLCPYNEITKECSDDWHNKIIIFNAANKKILFTDSLNLSKHEHISLKQFNQSNYLSFNRYGENNSSNGTIYYSNLYYNYNSKATINKAGRVR